MLLKEITSSQVAMHTLVQGVNWASPSFANHPIHPPACQHTHLYSSSWLESHDVILLR